MTASIPSVEAPAPRPRLFWLWVAAGLILLYARFAAAPTADFVLDDWSNLAAARYHSSARELAVLSLANMPRPASVLTTFVGMHLIGDAPGVYAALAMAGSLVTLLLLMRIAFDLTRSRAGAFATGLVFALLPNLCENFFFATLTLAADAFALPLYAASVHLGLRGVRSGSWPVLAAAAASYALALLAYEVGYFLPAVLLVLAPAVGWRKTVVRLLPFGAVFVGYALWRVTNAFGLYPTWYLATHHQLGGSLAAYFWNAKEIVSWWVGDHMLDSLLNGLRGFGTLALTPRRLFLAGNALVAAAGLLALLKTIRRETAPPPSSSALWFGLIGLVAGYIPGLLAYVPARLNYVPALGVCVLAAWGVARFRPGRWSTPAMLLVLLLLCVNQGTAVQWREAGRFNRRLFEHLQETRGEWSSRKVILLDTRALRQRLTAGLLPPASASDQQVAFYGNAPLLRGFVPPAMLTVILGDLPKVQVLLDVECGTQVHGTQLDWHERFDPTKPRQTPMADVFVVDVASATQR